MPEFKPLPFYQYSWSHPAISSEGVISPPYDVLSQADIKALADHKYNVVHIDSPPTYNKGAETLSQWISEGLIKQDDKPGFYIMATEYAQSGNKMRWGIFGGMKVHPFEDKKVFPHEQTYPKAKNDRLNLMKTTQGQLSPIFGIYDDPSLTMEEIGTVCLSLEPAASFFQEPGIFNRVWSVPDRYNAVLTGMLQDRRVFIADGHHRYETALNYKNSMPQSIDAPWNYVFTYLSNISSPGLEIFPYHRILSWQSNFDWEQLIDKAKDHFLITPADSAGQKDINRPDAFTLCLKKSFFHFTPHKQPHDTFEHIGAYILDKLFLRQAMQLSEHELASGNYLSYTHDQNQVISDVQSTKAQAGFLLQPVPMKILQKVCEVGQVMPRKSTYFYPKLPTGILFHLWGR
ncbi:DUF1015 family protein [Desulfonatronovibrio magnus]|uniref:DUF1015 family protein n=1 Tax=Desulfonatronovibrio magnus TaxID=698827 RepID=UPI0005EBC454|nr:DUF1015 domain-containing protein [Desulfonatronovibrio magnus]RQD61807.1 MAG: DUF1015 domain-containing protein [Desulfonatronovibrio sp. MSAO_Bac4]